MKSVRHTTRRGYRVQKYILLLILIVTVPASSCFAFGIPEKLRYDLTWSGIKAGEASLESADNGLYVQFISKATSAKWVSIFYRVEDSVVSTLKRGNDNSLHGVFGAAPYNYRIKLREGKHRRDKELIFDRTARKVTYINHLENERLDFSINDTTFDTLSSFYQVRKMPLEIGKPVFVEVFDSKKLYKVEVQVLRKEVLTTSLGTFNTILIKPMMKSEGIFYRKGDILIWLTDDEKRLPVLLKSKVAVGSIKATLVGGQY